MHLALNNITIGKTIICLRRNRLIESRSMGLPPPAPPALTGRNTFHSRKITTPNTDFLLYVTRTPAIYETKRIQHNGHIPCATHTSAQNQIRGPHSHACLTLPDSARSGTTRTMCLLYRLYLHTTSTLLLCAHVIHHPKLLCCLTD